MSRPKVVIKIGGNEVNNEDFLSGLIATIEAMHDVQPVIVHGGGKEIARLQSTLGLTPQFIEGLRVTDEASLNVAEMVLSGLVNKRLVARLIHAGVPAVGLSGVDLGLIRVDKMPHAAGDLGWVGRVVHVESEGLSQLMAQGLVVILSPISLGWDGHTYNVNADHAALAVAQALRAAQLIFVSNVPGVLIDDAIVPQIRSEQAEAWIQSGKIHGGMVPKVRSALEGVAGGIGEVRITDLAGLRYGNGTGFVI